MRRFAEWTAVLLALAIAGGWVYNRLLPSPAPPPASAELQALRDLRDGMRARLRERIVAAGEEGLTRAPEAGIMIGMPTSLTRSIVEQMAAGFFKETVLTVRNVHIHKSDEVKAKVVFRRTVGEFDLDADVIEARGLLRPGRPKLTFAGRRLLVNLPVELAEAHGDVRIRLQWRSKGLAANLVCGDFDVTRVVGGTAVPESYTVAVAFDIATEGSSVILRPDFAAFVVRLALQPTAEAWKTLDGLIEERRALCGTVMNKIDVKTKLAELLKSGFDVKIPNRSVKPVRLPAGIRQSLEVQGVTLDLEVKPTGLVLNPERLWYGADIEARRPAAPKALASGPRKAP